MLKDLKDLKDAHMSYRGTSLIRNYFLLGPCSSPLPSGIGWF